jgi:hypothetical protein
VTAHNVPGISDYVGDWAACKEPGTTGFKFGSDFSIFTECHGAQAKKRGQRGWACSQDCPDGDSAAGVCIRLSDRAWASRVLGQEGSGPQRSGHRMVWVRVHAQPRDVVVVGVTSIVFGLHSLHRVTVPFRATTCPHPLAMRSRSQCDTLFLGKRRRLIRYYGTVHLTVHDLLMRSATTLDALGVIALR